MSEIQDKKYYWEYLYMLGLTLLVGLVPFLCYKLPFQTMFALFIVILIVIIVLWKRPLSKRSLYLNDVLNIMGAVILGYFISFLIAGSMDTLIGIICGVAAMDVFSFTRRGKNTLNQKLTSQVNTLARLSICLPVPKKPGLQPIIGIGDLVYYSLIMMFTLRTAGISSGWIAVLIITVGQLVNILFILFLRNKPWFKGFPGTLFPGAFFLLCTMLNII